MAVNSPRTAFVIDASGDFFRYDPAKTFRKNIRELMADLEKQTTAEVKTRARAADNEGPEVAEAIRGRTSSLKGKPWAVSFVVSPLNPAHNQKQARRIFAMAAGRHNPVPHGTTKGVEGKTKAWARTRSLVRASGKAAAEKLLKRIA